MALSSNSKLSLIFVLLCATFIFSVYKQFPSAFDVQTAKEKQDWIWERVLKDNDKPGTYYGILDVGKLILPVALGGQVLTSVGHNESEEVDDGRKKLIHTVGPVAKFSMNWTENAKKYTGSFKQCDHGIARFSNAKKPSDGSTAPGISFKCLRDNVVSGSFVVMYKLQGQKSNNWFLHPFANHVHKPGPFELDLVAISQKFQGVEDHPGCVGFHRMGMYTQDGKKEDNIKVPFAVVFQPNPTLTHRCADAVLEGETSGCLKDIEAGTELYRVYGVENPLKTSELAGNMELLGTMVLTDKMVSSKFADQKIQYTHDFWADEMKNVSNAADWKRRLANLPWDFLDTDEAERMEPYLAPWAQNQMSILDN